MSGEPTVIRWGANGAELTLEIVPDGPVHVAGIGAREGKPGRSTTGVPLVELGLLGEGRVGSGGSAGHRNQAATGRLRYVSHETTESGRHLEIVQRDPTSGIRVTTFVEQFDDISALRMWNDVCNEGEVAQTVVYSSTLVLTGFVNEGSFADRLQVLLARNAWSAELRWQRLDLNQAGLVSYAETPGRGSTQGRFALSGVGSWSTGDYLPMGALIDGVEGQTWLWQVEHNGPWHWELVDLGPDLVLVASGPTDQEHQWRKILVPGETFTTVATSLAVSGGGFEGAVAELTAYRRAIRRVNPDNERLPVIFNDYMNCLFGDPSTEKELPLIAAAQKAGAEYFVIDAGWYADDEGWWDTVGAWEPSTTRFPDGLASLLDQVRAAGMVPGLWVEPEVVGIRSAVADQLPDEAFFMRGGRRAEEKGRYHLDYRHPAVIAHMDGVIDRLVGELGVGYFKFDYNVNIGVGTEVDADAPGDGLLGHNRAFLAWLDGLFVRHPSLVIENCSSGGMRTDYAQLARLSIHSTSDQTDPVRYASIAAASPTGVTPEQAAVWAYPQPDYDNELNAFCMVNAMLGRVHLSGRIDLMSSRQLGRVRAALNAYKSIRSQIRTSVPRWPLGLPGWYDPWVALALDDGEDTLLAVWRRGGLDRCHLKLPWLAGLPSTVQVLYPTDLPTTASWDRSTGVLRLTLPPAPSARLLRVRRR
ncbi:glycoside hydrolase family 36 protein [Tenggerimyces flavus]|uniref:Glycoside hydrolase family 36 protein n=1 Tax=Tenggerimyces flavus TaxID=1708749 RepID=A0ABV7YK67_9ACTN|nr:glycoside hydrolase family 36 protein [Tenggerimyces flavus]MBM7784929.1 alpha-galactosidase [Tenggerimyces flavus]